MALDVLIQEAQGLTEESLMEVVRFMRFIKSEHNLHINLHSAAFGWRHK